MAEPLDPKKFYHISRAAELIGVTKKSLDSQYRTSSEEVRLKHGKLVGGKLFLSGEFANSISRKFGEKERVLREAKGEGLVPVAEAFRNLPKKKLRLKLLDRDYDLAKFLEQGGMVVRRGSRKFVSKENLKKALEYLESVDTHMGEGDAMELLGLSKKGILLLRQRGEIPFLQVGKNGPVYPKTGLVGSYAWVLPHPDSTENFLAFKTARDFNERLEFLASKLGRRERGILFKAVRSVTSIPLEKTKHVVRLYNISEILSTAVKNKNAVLRENALGLLENFANKHNSRKSRHELVLKELKELHDKMHRL